MFSTRKYKKHTGYIFSLLLAFSFLEVSAQEAPPFEYDMSSGETVLIVKDSDDQALLDAFRHPQHHPIKVSGTYFLDLTSDLLVSKRVFSTPDPECQLTLALGLDQFQKTSVYNAETYSYQLVPSNSLSSACPSAVIVSKSKSFNIVVGALGELDNVGYLGSLDTLRYTADTDMLVDVLFNFSEGGSLLLDDVSLVQRGGGGKGGARGGARGGAAKEVYTKDQQRLLREDYGPEAGSVVASGGDDWWKKNKMTQPKTGTSWLKVLNTLFNKYTSNLGSKNHKENFVNAYNAAPQVARTIFYSSHHQNKNFISIQGQLIRR